MSEREREERGEREREREERESEREKERERRERERDNKKGQEQGQHQSSCRCKPRYKGQAHAFSICFYFELLEHSFLGNAFFIGLGLDVPLLFKLVFGLLYNKQMLVGGCEKSMQSKICKDRMTEGRRSIVDSCWLPLTTQNIVTPASFKAMFKGSV